MKEKYLKNVYGITHPPNTEILEVLDPEEGKRCYLVSALPSTQEAREWSKAVGGFVYLGSHALVHSSGNRSETYLVETHIEPATGETVNTLADIKASRAAVRKLTRRRDVGWTFSRLAKTVTDWLGFRDHVEATHRQLLVHGHYHYQKALPTTSPEARMFDMKSAYWQVVRRVKYPMFDIQDMSPNQGEGLDLRLAYHPLSVEERRRWERMLEAMEPLKRLRVALVGINVAGWDESPKVEADTGTLKFRLGEQVQRTRFRGALLPLAMLVVRCTYELTQIQSDLSKSLYSNIDCIMTEQHERPLYWDSLGIMSGLRAAGPAEIRGVGAWRCGDQKTALFDLTATTLEPQRPYRYKDTRWHRMVLEQ